MDPGEQIRFKVVAENFSEVSPQPQATLEATQGQSTQEKTPNSNPAYSITVSLN